MYYQVLIETNEKVDESTNKQYFELDKPNLADIEAYIVAPYLRKEELQFDGQTIKFREIKRILIKETQKTTTELVRFESTQVLGNFLTITQIDILSYKEHAKDITTTVFNRMLSAILAKPNTPLVQAAKQTDHAKVLLVHSKDHLAKDVAVTFLEKLGISSIILHEQMRGEKTILEKIEENVNIGFAIVLYTPTGFELKPRAQQHIVFEHGYLIGKLGRRKVCALVKSNVETPLQSNGVIYVPLDVQNAWHQTLANELTRAGFHIDLNIVKAIQAT
ncbi:MAG TPA: nucleotide-binding protein [Aquirhabdus sp.]